MAAKAKSRPKPNIRLISVPKDIKAADLKTDEGLGLAPPPFAVVSPSGCIKSIESLEVVLVQREDSEEKVG